MVSGFKWKLRGPRIFFVILGQLSFEAELFGQPVLVADPNRLDLFEAEESCFTGDATQAALSRSGGYSRLRLSRPRQTR
jgi:hypothetical protein